MAEKDLRQRFPNYHTAQHPQYESGKPDIVKTGLYSWQRTLCKLVVSCFVILLLALTCLKFFSLHAIAFSLPNPPKLEGPLKPNSHLLLAERLYEGKLLGPESIIFDHGHIYTGTSDGQILHIHQGQVTTIARLGKQPCGGYDNEPTCGRPLGMRFDADGYLIVCDAYLGLHKVNVATGDVHLLLPGSSQVSGRAFNFMNDLDIGSDGSIYFSDSSDKFQRRDFFLELLDGRASGRLLRYDPLHNTTEVLLDHVHFANGVQLSRYEDFVLVCELGSARILRYHLKGLQAGQSDVFADNLPVLPDNIRRSARGGFWITGGLARYDGKSFNAYDFLSSRPWIRWFISKLPYSTMMNSLSPCTIIVELDSNGNIIRTLMDLNGENIRLSSEIEDDAGTLYIGSFSEPYIARLNTHNLPKEF